jgi:hypothetical protein
MQIKSSYLNSGDLPMSFAPDYHTLSTAFHLGQLLKTTRKRHKITLRWQAMSGSARIASRTSRITPRNSASSNCSAGALHSSSSLNSVRGTRRPAARRSGNRGTLLAQPNPQSLGQRRVCWPLYGQRRQKLGVAAGDVSHDETEIEGFCVHDWTIA